MKTKDTPKKEGPGEYTFRGWIIRRSSFSSEWECGPEVEGGMDWDQTYDTKADCVAHVREKTVLS